LGGSEFSGSSLDYRSQNTDNIFILKINKDGNSIKSAVVGGNKDDGSFDLRFALMVVLSFAETPKART
jgi:hypothetical protein